MKTYHVVFNSGGIGSYIAAKRVAARVGTKRLIHLFTDTLSEDEDLYRFLRETTKAIGGEVQWLKDGRNLWQLFHDHRMIANTRASICSKELKRDVAVRYLNARFPGGKGVFLYFGIDHGEAHRFHGGKGKIGIKERWKPYYCRAPLCEPPHLTKCEMLQECERDGIDPPRLYDEGFPRNNCGGFCVKGGHAHFLHLLRNRPDLYEYHAQKEDEFRKLVGKDVAIMRDRRGGVTTPLPMIQFREEIISGKRTVNRRDWGKGCQCLLEEEE